MLVVKNQNIQESASRLSQIISPEFTIKDYNLYQLLNEVAEFLGGVNWEITIMRLNLYF